jgi:integrase
MVQALPAPAGGNQITYDDIVPGFGARVTAAGARAFILNYRTRGDGRARRYTIGGFPDWSTGAARDEAKRLKRAIDGGADPVGELAATRSAPTVDDLCDRFLEHHMGHLRASTVRDYQRRIRNIIRPQLGKQKVAAIKFADMQDLHAKVGKQRGPYAANRTLQLLSKMFNLAVAWEWRANNPVKGVERNQEHARQRYLSNEELKRLMAALAADEDQQAANILRFLLLTGARKNEVLTAKWADFDLKAGVWTKPGARTKQKTEHRVPLSAPARMLLAGLEQESEYVFSGRWGRGHRITVEGPQKRIWKRAKITGLRVHDLRHSYASQLASAGVGLHVIGALLGHTQPGTTHRYAHLMDDPLRAATERAGAIIAGKVPADVVPLTKRGQR